MKVSQTQRNYVVEQARNAIRAKRDQLEAKTPILNSSYGAIIASGKYKMKRVSQRKLTAMANKCHPCRRGKRYLETTDILETMTDVKAIQARIQKKNRATEAVIDKKMGKVSVQFNQLKRDAMLSGSEEIAKALASFEAAVAKVK